MAEFDLEFITFPHDSYSRQLDRRVADSELRWGYDRPPPPADTHDYDEKRLETKKEYHIRDKR